MVLIFIDTKEQPFYRTGTSISDIANVIDNNDNFPKNNRDGCAILLLLYEEVEELQRQNPNYDNNRKNGNDKTCILLIVMTTKRMIDWWDA
jgi:hypothetical protein